MAPGEIVVSTQAVAPKASSLPSTTSYDQPHRFVVSSHLKKIIIETRLNNHGRWLRAPHDIVTSNDKIVARGGFTLEGAVSMACSAVRNGGEDKYELLPGSATKKTVRTDATTLAPSVSGPDSSPNGMPSAVTSQSESNKHALLVQKVLDPPPADIIRCSALPLGSRGSCYRFDTTKLCVVQTDSLTAALALGDDVCVLNFANAETPGGRYRVGARAQEEDLCRLLPQLYPSLLKSKHYPIQPGTALLSKDLEAVRRPGTYELCCPSLGKVTVVTAAMPCGIADHRPKGGWKGSAWEETVILRIRAVLNAARGYSNLVLGAFGCGAFGNPAPQVARVFREVISSEEFRGAFQHIVFAIIDPAGTGNLKPFQREIIKIDESRESGETLHFSEK